jgi:hypothetical protein
MNEINIFKYLDYRAFLKAFYYMRKKVNNIPVSDSLIHLNQNEQETNQVLTEHKSMEICLETL